MKKLLISILKFYKKNISPFLGDNCRFKPTCSEYAMQAIDMHGSIKGFALSVWRVLRCNPFGKHGFDPIPEKGKWANPEKKVWRS